jgi:hypothetical protein
MWAFAPSLESVDLLGDVGEQVVVLEVQELDVY